MAAFIVISLTTGIVGGLYPAIYLSGFHPVRILRGTHKSKPGSGRLRQGLVIFQFCWSILLIIGTLTVYNQLMYSQSKNLDLEQKNLLYMTLEGQAKEKYRAFRDELLKNPEFLEVTRSDQNLLSVGSSTSNPKWEGKDPDSVYEIKIINAGYNFVNTMKVDLSEGRGFVADRDLPAFKDNMNFIINEKLARIVGAKTTLGQQLRFRGDTGTIISVVKDFHISSLHNPIAPLIIRLDPGRGRRLFARIAPGKEERAIEVLSELHDRFNPGFPLTYRFVNEDFDRTYRNETVLGELAT